MTNQDLMALGMLLFVCIMFLCSYSLIKFYEALKEILKIYKEKKEKISFKFYLILFSTFAFLNIFAVSIDIKYAEKVKIYYIFLDIVIVSSFLASIWEFLFKYWLHKAKQSST